MYDSESRIKLGSARERASKSVCRAYIDAYMCARAVYATLSDN